MSYFPAFLDLDGRSCLLVGGGQTAARKLRRLIKAGARVTVVAPEVDDEIEALAATGSVTLHRRPFLADDVTGRAVVQSATGRETVDRRVSEAAQAAGIQVNVVDRPALCSFIVPSVVRRGRLVLAISTGGASPALAKWLRIDLERRYPPEMGKLLSRLARGREQVKKKVPSFNRRRQLYEKAMKAYFYILEKELK